MTGSQDMANQTGSTAYVFLTNQPFHFHRTASSDSWTVYWNLVKTAQQKGPQGYLESLYYLNVVRTYETSPERQQQLSNYLMTTLLPTISSYFLPQPGANNTFIFTPVILQNAVAVMQTIQLIHQLFPQEGEYLLHLTDIAQQLVMVKSQEQGVNPQLIATLQRQAASLSILPQQTINVHHQPHHPQLQTQRGYVPPQQLSEREHLEQRLYIPPVQSDTLSVTSSSTEPPQRVQQQTKPLFPVLNSPISPVMGSPESVHDPIPVSVSSMGYIHPLEADIRRKAGEPIPLVQYVQFPTTSMPSMMNALHQSPLQLLQQQQQGEEEEEEERREREQSKRNIEKHREQVACIIEQALSSHKPTHESIFPEIVEVESPMEGMVVNEAPLQLQVFGVQPVLERQCR